MKRTPSPARLIFELVLGLVWWFALAYGFIIRDPWYCAMGAFFLLHDALTDGTR